MAGNFIEANFQLKPFLKWAGGKRWFVANHSNLIPKKYNRYIEPFLGSGAVFFYLQPKQALLGDLNIELVETYLAIKKNWELVYCNLEIHHKLHSHDYYYKIRNSKPKNLAAKAARFIYLNRTCWNGLYRVNRSGVFNVPIGTRSSVIFKDDRFDKISESLEGALFFTYDFEELINMAKKGDLVFVDPPYTVRHNNNAFIKYNENLFSWHDQERLFHSLIRAKNRGVQIVGTNAYHQNLRELYKDDFQMLAVSRNSCISSTAETRKKYEELVFFTEVPHG